MSTSIPSSTLEKFTSFGDLLRFLRRRTGLTQLEFSNSVGYSGAQISRLEQNQRLPDLTTIKARFVLALGLEDEPKAVARLLELAADVRREDAPALGLCPYKGLNYFDENDADLFVGREAVTARLTDRVLALTVEGKRNHEVRFLAIVGASGSGKSSLVRAGLMPALHWNARSAEWPMHVLTPGAHPLESLAAGLTESAEAAARLMADLVREPRSLHRFIKRAIHPGSDSRVLLIIDQFEELFALSHSEQERTSFIANLLTAASQAAGPAVVVITLRADFYAHCAGYVQLREALAQHQEYIGAMSDEELRRSIEEPARRGRWEMEQGLVDQLLHDVGHEPGALPLLSHALLETWQRRRGHMMTLSGYASSGGVRGAIAETAEAVFADQFTHAQQAIARRIFLRLTELGDESAPGDTRRRASFSELILKTEEAATTQAVLKILADARLITTGADSAEVAHEALIREWPTLRGWLEDDRAGLRLHRHLTEAAQEWSAANREQDLLWRSARLTQAREWAAGRAEELNSLEREFLAASIENSERELAERESRRQRELQTAHELAETQSRAAKQLRRRAQYLASALLLTAVLAGAALFFGGQARQSAAQAQVSARAADQARQTALRQQRLANERELAAASLSNLTVDPERSILLALQAVSVTDSVDMGVLPEVEEALHRAVLASRVRLTLCCHMDSLVTASYSPDGGRIATASQDGTAKIWDAVTGKELMTLGEVNESNAVNFLAYSPDGTRIVTGHDDGTAKVWDVATGRVILTLSGHKDFVNSVAYSPDGAYLATTSGDNTVKMWDAVTGKELYGLNDLDHSAGDVAFSPDGKLLATAGGDTTARVWDVATGRELVRFTGHTNAVSKVTFSPDGVWIATVSDDHTARVWAAKTGVERLLINLPAAGLGVAFSPDGKWLATSGFDGTAIVWDVTSGKELFALNGHSSAIYDVSFSPDGKRLVTAGRDKTARVWDLTPGRELLTFTAASSPGTVSSLAYSPDGTRLATANNNQVRVWDASGGQLLLTLLGHSSYINHLAYSPDGTRLVTTSDDNTAKVWDAFTGRELLTFTGHTARVESAAFSPDGKYLATAGDDGTARLWNAGTGAEILRISRFKKAVTDIAFSPDGKVLVTTGYPSSGDSSLRTILWDAATGRQLFALSSPGNSPSTVAFSPTGEQLAVGYMDGSIRVYFLSADGLHATEIYTALGHSGLIEDIAYSRYGDRFASASDDGTTKIWFAGTGEELLTLLGHEGGVRAVAFNQDGTRLATGGLDGTVRVYLLRIEDLAALARTRLTRPFTTDECQKYLHVPECPAAP
jgi:WD40 repeat protein